MPRTCSLALLLALLEATALAAPPAPFAHAPALAGDAVIFVHADELWIAPIAGGSAARLTTVPGKKLNARVSPDGAYVAFTLLAAGNVDVYAMAVRGGDAVRLTYHPALDVAVGWTPDSRAVVFTSRRHSVTHPIDKLFTVPRAGGAAQQLPFTQGGPAAFSPDGKHIAFNRNSPESWWPWRGYRGGRRAAIAIHDLASHRETVIAPSPGNDVYPMWAGDAIYFASDRDGRMNLYRYETATRALRQLTHHRDTDVRHPSLGTGRIVYEIDGTLRIFELATGRDSPLPVAIDEPMPERAVRPAAIAPYLTSFDVVPDGTRALLSARGELVELDSGGKKSIDLTQTPGIREHGAVYAPDGKRIAYVSDRNGEYEIYLHSPGSRVASDSPLTRRGGGFPLGLRWSPDGRRLLFIDQTQSLYLLDVASGATARIDASRNAPIESYDWTPDSASVIYARTDDNQLSRLYRYDLASRKREALGDGMTDDASPAVGGTGDRRVYFLSARNLRTSFSDFEQTFNFNDTAGVYALSLDRPDPTNVERLPIEPGALSRLSWADGRLLYLARDRRKGTQSLHAFDVARRQDTTIADDIADYRTAKGVVVVQSGERLSWLWGSRRSDVELGPLTVQLDPVAEWRQIFADAWRFERDYDQEPSLHGVDWRAVRMRYERLLPGVGSRDELNYLLVLMAGELGTSHAWADGGDSPGSGGPPVGVLGGELVADRDRYRVARVFRGDASAPETRSPLAAAGIKPGEYVVAIDGRALTTSEDISARLVGTVGKELTLDIAATPGGPARSVNVTPAADEMAARYVDWLADNRARVAKATGGRCGYIHVPDTGRNGIAAFARQFFAQIDRDALIIDIRWNHGGLFPASMIEHLRRIPLAAYASRHGNHVRVPGAAVIGPKVLVTNHYAGSGGDAFATYFRIAGLGPIVGGRTQGATVGNITMPALVDGGEIGVPALAYVPGSGPPTENTGVVPDIEVEPALVETAAEPDPQLAAAIAAILPKLPPRR
jgi:tricorn protease